MLEVRLMLIKHVRERERAIGCPGRLKRVLARENGPTLASPIFAGEQ